MGFYSAVWPLIRFSAHLPGDFREFVRRGVDSRIGGRLPGRRPGGAGGAVSAFSRDPFFACAARRGNVHFGKAGLSSRDLRKSPLT
jgi:hypothetical protein